MANGNSSWSARMSPTSTDRITLTGAQHRELTRMTRAGRTEQRLVTRAEIVLAAAAGESNAEIARWLGICADTVRKWRHRWCAAPGAASLADAKRSGRRPKFTAVQVARVKAMACTPPAGHGITAVAVVVPGPGRTGDHRRDLRVDIAGDHPPVAVAGRAQTVAVPVVDLHHRPRLRRQGATGARPLRPHVGRHTVGRRRLCDLRRREDLHPGPLPLPPHPACRHGPPDPGQP